MRFPASAPPAAMLHREMEHVVKKSNPNTNTDRPAVTAFGTGWPGLEAAINRLTEVWRRRSLIAADTARSDRSRALVALPAVLPTPPAVPVGLAAAALTLTVTSTAAVGPSHPALGSLQPLDNGVRIVADAKPAPEPAGVADAADDVVVLGAMSFASSPNPGGMRFLTSPTRGAAADGWAGLFGEADGLKLVDFGVGNSAIARLVG